MNTNDPFGFLAEAERRAAGDAEAERLLAPDGRGRGVGRANV
jgi:hypothetical protein